MSGYIVPVGFGMILALFFCPVFVALYFGSLIPVVVSLKSVVLVLLAYALGTSIPIIVFAFLIGFGKQMILKYFKKVAIIEKCAKYITGIIFILVGFYYCVVYIYL